MVLTSTLSRALQTASFLQFDNCPIIAEELCRSSFTKCLSSKRINISDKKLEFEYIDFSNCVAEEDAYYQSENRSLWKSRVLAVRERANRFLAYLEDLPYKDIVVVSHSSFIRNVLAQVVGLNDNHDVLVGDNAVIVYNGESGWELRSNIIVAPLEEKAVVDK